MGESLSVISPDQSTSDDDVTSLAARCKYYSPWSVQHTTDFFKRIGYDKDAGSIDSNRFLGVFATSFRYRQSSTIRNFQDDALEIIKKHINKKVVLEFKTEQDSNLICMVVRNICEMYEEASKPSDETGSSLLRSGFVSLCDNHQVWETYQRIAALGFEIGDAWKTSVSGHSVRFWMEKIMSCTLQCLYCYTLAPGGVGDILVHLNKCLLPVLHPKTPIDAMKGTEYDTRYLLKILTFVVASGHLKTDLCIVFSKMVNVNTGIYVIKPQITDQHIEDLIYFFCLLFKFGYFQRSYIDAMTHYYLDKLFFSRLCNQAYDFAILQSQSCEHLYFLVMVMTELSGGLPSFTHLPCLSDECFQNCRYEFYERAMKWDSITMSQSRLYLDDIRMFARLVSLFRPEEIPQAQRWLQERLEKFTAHSPAWYAHVLKHKKWNDERMETFLRKEGEFKEVEPLEDELTVEEIAKAATEQDKMVSGVSEVLDLFKHVPTLQHLCRRHIVRIMSWSDIESLHISPGLKRYLKYGDFAHNHMFMRIVKNMELCFPELLEKS